MKWSPTLWTTTFYGVPMGSPSHGGNVVVLCLWHIPSELAHSFLFCSCVCFYLYGPFNCISFHKFSWQNSASSFCSSDLISALLVLSTIYLFMKVFLSPDMILCGWLGLKHQLIDWPLWLSLICSICLYLTNSMMTVQANVWNCLTVTSWKMPTFCNPMASV